MRSRCVRQAPFRLLLLPPWARVTPFRWLGKDHHHLLFHAWGAYFKCKPHAHMGAAAIGIPFVALPAAVVGCFPHACNDVKRHLNDMRVSPLGLALGLVMVVTHSVRHGKRPGALQSQHVSWAAGFQSRAPGDQFVVMQQAIPVVWPLPSNRPTVRFKLRRLILRVAACCC